MVEARTNAAPLFLASALSYAANCALGTAVATDLVRLGRWRWLHHALYITTCVLAALAVSAAWWGRPRRPSRRAALTLAPAAVPLAAIAQIGTHRRRHPLVALTAAPFFILGVAVSRRAADRK